MFPAAFDYRAPATLDETLSLLGEMGDEAKILAGGQSLIPLLSHRGLEGVFCSAGCADRFAAEPEAFIGSHAR